MDEERINLLAEKWRNGTLTEAERQEFEHWYVSFDDSELEVFSSEDQETLGQRLYQYISREKDRRAQHRKKSLWRKAAAAAAVLVCLSGGAYFFDNVQKPDRQSIVNYDNDIPPGDSKATLTLADGSTIVLEDAEEGELTELAGTRIIKPDSGSLVYTGSGNAGETGYNTLSTPRGGQFKVTLPDGTKVWLNAASSITYPIVFNKDERQIEMAGEAYFEVARDKSKPFKVHTVAAGGMGQIVEVLGTHFNINAYPDEKAVKTTLLEGSVMIKAENQKLLKPGQQSTLDGDALFVHQVDTMEAVAWKNGLFHFRDASIKTVMRQLARWYDVEVVYEGDIPEREFSGKIYRNINASQALELLSFTKVHLRIEGRKIIVNP